MRTIETATDKAVCFDEVVWLQERQIITFTHKSGALEKSVVRLHYGSLGTNDAIATYNLDTNNSATIDVTDLIRANYKAPKTIYLWCGHSISSAIPITIPYRIGGLINPSSVIIPRISEAERLENIAGQKIGNTILPPHKILKDLGHEDTNIRCEFYPTNAEVQSLDDYEWGEEVGIVNGVERSTELNLQQSTLNVYCLHDRVGTWKMEALECDKRYAAVRWVSFTGATRLHTFEVRDCTREAVGVVDLETIDGSWNQIKGRKDSFKLFIDGLDAYDVWYYSDIVTSSKVEVSLDGQNWQQVEVVAKSATTPNSNEGALGKVEIQINWKKYDAVNM